MFCARVIENKAKHYEKNAGQLDEAMGQAVEEANLIDIAPGNEQAEMDDLVGGIVDNDSKVVKEQIVSRLPNDASKTADIYDGLVNGSACTVGYIENIQENTDRQSIVRVLFDNTSTGCACRSKNKHMYHDPNDSE
ncbi:hypothetical protein MAR_016484 [Mya arenaria]|uniref:Uncharacterized protein n=1 Tax=Mya arenaria TaxID=6604 RepID=A0ABY7FJY9_MYAAR|nr:hypothetical protein MAR_016484 [Mya arenaria]